VPSIAIPRSQRSRSLVLAFASIGLSALVLLVPLLPFRVDMLMTLVLAAIPVVWGLRRHLRGELDWFEIFLLCSVLNLFYFGIGALWLQANPVELFSRSLAPYITPALGLGVLGSLACFAGYLAVGNKVRPSPFGRYVPVSSAAYVVPTCVGFIGQIGAVAQERLLSIARAGVSPVLSAVQQFAPVFLFAWALLWIQFWSGNLRKAQKYFLFLVVVPMVAVVLFGLFGGKEMAIVFISYPAVAFWYARRKLPWKIMTACVLVGVFVVFPLYNTYRNQNRDLETSRKFSKAIESASGWDRTKFMDESIKAFMNRMSLVYCVAAILRDVPEAVPYRFGETLVLAPIGLFVPRFLWPDKPKITIGREFGETFQLVNPIDQTTQIAPTFTGEFFWNFDLPGVIVGMFLFGAALRVFYERFGAGRDVGPLRHALYMGLLPTVIHIEGNVAAMFGVGVKVLVILWLYFLYARRSGWIAAVESARGTDRLTARR
jgi:hypothetical protein